MRNPSIVDAINRLRPNSQYAFLGDFDYESLEWLDETKTKPTKEELTEAISVIDVEYNAKKYQRDRAAEYPSFADQFDALYHGGYDAWKAQIDAIKAKYPKP